MTDTTWIIDAGETAEEIEANTSRMAYIIARLFKQLVRNGLTREEAQALTSVWLNGVIRPPAEEDVLT